MIGVIVIVLTLILVFIEKPHLLKKPFNLLKIFMVIFLVATAAFSSWKEFNSDAQQERDSRKIDSLTGRAETLESIVRDFREENQLLHVTHQDSLKQYHYNSVGILAKYGLKVDTLRNTIRKMEDKISKDVPPTLRIVDPPALKQLYEKKENVIECLIQALNAEAHIIEYKYCFVNLTNNALGDFKTVTGSSLNNTSIIAKDEVQTLMVFLDRDKSLSPTDPFIFAIEFRYKSRENKLQKPVRKIYEVSVDAKMIRNASNVDFKTVSNFLDAKDFWIK